MGTACPELYVTRERSGPGTQAEAEDVRRAVGGDQSAFERLYRQHVGRIHGLAHRMVGAEDAEEATQDVFVRAWRKLETYRGDAAFGTWLYRLAINHLLGHRTARRREERRMVVSEGVLERRPGRAAQPELTMDFEWAIAKLPDGARKVFVLHDVEGFKHHEIAKLLGVTTGTTKAQLHRARMALREYLDR